MFRLKIKSLRGKKSCLMDQYANKAFINRNPHKGIPINIKYLRALNYCRYFTIWQVEKELNLSIFIAGQKL